MAEGMSPQEVRMMGGKSDPSLRIVADAAVSMKIAIIKEEKSRCMSPTEEFHPTPILKHPLLQTVLASSLRKLKPYAVSRPGTYLKRYHVRLIGHYSAHPEAKGLAIL
jgi:hypothetical protein